MQCYEIPYTISVPFLLYLLNMPIIEPMRSWLALRPPKITGSPFQILHRVLEYQIIEINDPSIMKILKYERLELKI